LERTDNRFGRELSLVRIGAGLLFFQHGAEKLWGFAGARIVGFNFHSLFGIAGPLEVIGGALLVLGLFTRSTAFILSGEMAVAYFTRWAPRSFWPISNGGEEAVLFCFLFFWLVFAGPGPWSLEQVLHKSPGGPLQRKAGLWEGDVRTLLRAVYAFTFSLHGYRLMFGVLPALAGRRGAPAMPLDALPQAFGALQILGGLLLFIGLFVRPTVVVLIGEMLAAYFYIAWPRSIWPIRNGGDELLLYLLVFGCLAVSGAGRWSWDELRKSKSASEGMSTAVGNGQTSHS